LERIGVAAATCPFCHEAPETVQHFLLECPSFDEERSKMLEKLPFALPEESTDQVAALLGVLKSLTKPEREAAVASLDVYIQETGRFAQPESVAHIVDLCCVD
jgi:hypothetical protein